MNDGILGTGRIDADFDKFRFQGQVESVFNQGQVEFPGQVEWPSADRLNFSLRGLVTLLRF
jgi:hypothetical protein